MWKKRCELPTKYSEGKTTILDNKVYCGGGTANDENEDHEYLVFSYDLSQDTWTTLPPLPVKYFSLGQVNDKLVAVGGRKKLDGKPSDEVHSYEEKPGRWKQIIPPMPTARFASGVLSLHSALVVAGGRNSMSSFTDVVEVYNSGTFQWCKTDPLPTPCSSVSLVAFNKKCFALGGYKYLERLNQTVYISVEDLLRNAVPANQTSRNGGTVTGSSTRSAWKSMPSTPRCQPSATVLAGNLLAIGGKGTSSTAYSKEMYMYLVSSNSWVYFSDLPSPQFGTAVADLASTVILVIGGYGDKDRLSTVYQGTLNFKF